MGVGGLLFVVALAAVACESSEPEGSLFGAGGLSGRGGSAGTGGYSAGAGGGEEAAAGGGAGSSGAGAGAGHGGASGAGGEGEVGGAAGGSGAGGSGVGGEGGAKGEGEGGAGGGASGEAGQGGAAGGGKALIANEIATGGFHSCALVENGEVRCWGSNSAGQLGDGTTTKQLTPVPVLTSPGGSPLTGARALVTGHGHSCVLIGDGEVHCWGWNSFGQLGDGTSTNRMNPAPVLTSPGGAPLGKVQALTLGFAHTCGLLDSGEVRCWGWNEDKQLGDGTTTNRKYPVPVLSGPGGPPFGDAQALGLSIAEHTCALLNSSEVRCWGDNGYGQVGDGTFGLPNYRAYPVPVVQSPGGAPLKSVKALALGASHTCVLHSDEKVRCWGMNNRGQVGDGTSIERHTPVLVLASPDGPPFSGVRALALGGWHSCALVGESVRCWGENAFGQVGDGTTDDRKNPVPLLESPGGPPLAGVQAMAASFQHSCARLADGSVRCWGSNLAGQLGDGTTTERHTPVPVLFAPGAEVLPP